MQSKIRTLICEVQLVYGVIIGFMHDNSSKRYKLCACKITFCPLCCSELMDK